MHLAGFCSPTGLRIHVPHRLAAGERCTPLHNYCPTSARLTAPSFATKAVGATAAATLFMFSFLSPASAVVSAPLCVNGEGPGCESTSAESPLIRELLEKSRANREKNDKTTLENYWKRGYGDYFSFGYNKELKQGEDGKWSLQDPDDPFTAAQRLIESITKNKGK